MIKCFCNLVCVVILSSIFNVIHMWNLIIKCFYNLVCMIIVSVRSIINVQFSYIVYRT